jgi:hypothetical protein
MRVPKNTAKCVRIGRKRATNPHWDVARRELRMGARTVKRFRRPAPLQEAILATFEEEGWPPRIDDPLPENGRNQKQRLREIIANLKPGKRWRLIRFYADGQGLGICWEVCD